MNTDSKIPNYWLFGLLSTASRHGVTAERLFRQAGLGEFHAYQCQQWVSARDIDRILSVLPALCNNPSCFIDLAEHPCLDRLTPLIETAENIKEALDLFAQYRQLVHPFFVSTATEHRDRVVLSYTPVNDRARQPHYAEYFLAGCAAYLKKLTANEGILLGVTFRHRRPHYVNRYDEFFKAPIRFGTATDSMVIPTRDYYRKLNSANRKIKQWALDQAQSVCHSLPEIPLAEQVKNHLMQQDRAQKISIADAAAHFHLSQRSLQRRLSHQGTSYSQIKQGVLRHRAEALLGDRSRSTQSISEGLGFSEISAFCKAYKNWTGRTPAQFRKAVNPTP